MKIDKIKFVLAAIKFSENLGYAITIPAIPFLAKAMGVSEIWIGLVFAIYSISQLLSGPIIGHLSDKIGRRLILLISQLGTIAGFLLIALSSFTGSYWILILSRLVDGFTGGNVALVDSIVADKYQKLEQEKLYGTLSTVAGAAILIGPVLGGFLFSFGINILVLVSVTLSLATFLLTVYFLPETLTCKADSIQFLFPDFKPLLQNSILKKIFFLKFIQEVIVNGIIISIPVYVANLLGYSQTQIGSLLSLFFFFAFIYQIVFLPKTLQIQNKFKILILGFSFYFVAILLNIFFLNQLGIILLGLFFMSGVAVLQPAFTILLSQISTSKNTGLIMGLNQFVSSLGQIFGPVLAYTSFHFFGNFGLLISFLILSIIALLVSIFFQSQKQQLLIYE